MALTPIIIGSIALEVATLAKMVPERPLLIAKSIMGGMFMALLAKDIGKR